MEINWKAIATVGGPKARPRALHPSKQEDATRLRGVHVITRCS